MTKESHGWWKGLVESKVRRHELREDVEFEYEQGVPGEGRRWERCKHALPEATVVDIWMNYDGGYTAVDKATFTLPDFSRIIVRRPIGPRNELIFLKPPTGLALSDWRITTVRTGVVNRRNQSIGRQFG